MALSERARMALLGFGSAAAAFAVFHGFRGASSSPIDAVPQGSFLVATVDARGLRTSPVFATLFGKQGSPGARALGVSGLASACGFDPLSRVDDLAIAIPEEGDKGEFGLAAKIEVTRDELEKCSRALADERGTQATTKEQGSFAVLESKGGSRIAYGSGGLLVVGKGAWLDAMLGAADHKSPGISASGEHAALRRAITSQAGWRSPTLVVTAILPRSLRDRLRKEMDAEEDAPSRSDASNATMAGVLGVNAVGLAVNAGVAGGALEADAELACDSASDCAEVSKLIQKKRLAWSQDFLLRLAGFGALIDSLQVKEDGARLHVTASASADAMAGALERVLAHRSRPAPPAPAGAAVSPPIRPKADERLPAADAGHAPRPPGSGPGP